MNKKDKKDLAERTPEQKSMDDKVANLTQRILKENLERLVKQQMQGAETFTWKHTSTNNIRTFNDPVTGKEVSIKLREEHATRDSEPYNFEHYLREQSSQPVAYEDFRANFFPSIGEEIIRLQYKTYLDNFELQQQLYGVANPFNGTFSNSPTGTNWANLDHGRIKMDIDKFRDTFLKSSRNEEQEELDADAAYQAQHERKMNDEE